jgi:hypothetical protein
MIDVEKVTFYPKKFLFPVFDVDLHEMREEQFVE